MTRRTAARIASVTTLLFVGFIVQADMQAPSPGPEYKRLEMFVGTWNVEGQAQATPYGPAGKVVGVDRFEWLPGGFFLAHHWDARQGSIEMKGLEVVGYDARVKGYTSRFFDNAGNTGSMRATVQGNAWRWAGDSEVGGKPVKERCTLIVVSPDSFTNKCEFSTDGIKWLPNLDLRGTKVK